MRIITEEGIEKEREGEGEREIQGEGGDGEREEGDNKGMYLHTQAVKVLMIFSDYYILVHPTNWGGNYVIQ